MMRPLPFETIRLADDGIVILDQRKLPGKEEYIVLRTAEDVWHAIKDLAVRGAPLIGVAAAYGFYISVKDIEKDFENECRRVAEYLDSSRPTAVNLSWALRRMEAVMDDNLQSMTIPELKDRLGKEAADIRDEDIRLSRSIGEHGFSLLHHGDGILTHCNAGTLATAKYGTALAPVYIALEHGWNDLHVYCDETRPLLQGARLSAFEMQTAGVDTTLLCDNMASITMKRGKINIVFVGADRVAANGDFANKIGTSGVAILARYYGIPFYCLAPSSTIDMSIRSGDDIPIEERAPEEVTEMWYKHRMAPEGVKVCNPAFDVTDHSLVTGIITEKGIAYPPFDRAFERMGIR